MVFTSSLLPISQYSPHHFHQSRSATIPKWGFTKNQYGRTITRKNKSQAFRVFATSDRRRQIEAINGAWAMIGLTAGLVIEGQSGKSILQQLAGYLSAIFNLFIG